MAAGPVEQLPSHIQKLNIECESQEAEVQALQAAINRSASQLLESLRASVELLLFILRTFQAGSPYGKVAFTCF